MNKTILVTALILGILAIVFGAFGAHGLKKVLSLEQLASFETGVKYQMYHALFLVILSFLPIPETTKKIVFVCILTGVILFSFSIYLLTTSGITQINFGKIGFVTPIGGLFLIAGWGFLLLKALKL